MHLKSRLIAGVLTLSASPTKRRFTLAIGAVMALAAVSVGPVSADPPALQDPCKIIQVRVPTEVGQGDVLFDPQKVVLVRLGC